MIDALVRWIFCCIFGHRYQPSFEKRQLVARSRGRRIVRNQFRFFCCRCGEPTPWTKWSKRDQFLKEHKPSWSNSRSLI